MSRSVWKGPFTRIPSLLSRGTQKHALRPGVKQSDLTRNDSSKKLIQRSVYPSNENIKIWCRAFMITPRDLSNTYNVHNGKKWLQIRITRQMIGHRLGEFFSTRQPTQHKVYKRRQTRVSR
jgi:small subunit ribosomal protein S19